MSKQALAKNLILQTRSSYWFVPTVLVVCSVVAVLLTLWVDRYPESVFYIWPDSWATTQIDGARSMISVIAQSILGVAGVMFSVTIVAVSFASGNFGPRLIGNFMKDRGTQWSLGILIGNFVFALMLLRAMHSGDDAQDPAIAVFVPHMSLGLALLFTGVSIMTVIYYVHHIPETINVSNISAGLGKRLRYAIEVVIDNQPPVDGNLARPTGEANHSLCLTRNGYVQNYDRAQLLELAEEHALFVHVQLGVGAFVSPSSPVMAVWGPDALPDDLREDLCGCFVVGSTPTEEQNLLFIVQQLVEMIARALSPGVNDPFTAINCMNWLYAGLSAASLYNGGLKPAPMSRVSGEDLTFERIFEHGFGAAYSYIKTDNLTAAHCRVLLQRLAVELDDADDVAFVKAWDAKLDIQADT